MKKMREIIGWHDIDWRFGLFTCVYRLAIIEGVMVLTSVLNTNTVFKITRRARAKLLYTDLVFTSEMHM
jgi:hypothetical protein